MPKHIHVVGAAILLNGKCLIAKRGPAMSLGGKWEFPGGKVEAGEHPQYALVREIKEELGIDIEVGELLGRGSADLGQIVVDLDVYAASWRRDQKSSTPTPHEHAELRWVTGEDLAALDWAEADIPVLSAVQAALGGEASV
jgi:8-oxo-dGTP diphosphatase